MSLRSKMIQGALWSLLEKGGQQGLALVVFMVLARLLGPQEYGLANLCFIYFTLASMIVMGLVDGIVSLQVEDDLRLSSLFWAVVGVGTGISALCLATAVPLARFMEEPRLVGLLAWFSPVPILVALAAVPNLLILKELEFRIYAIRTLIATLAGGIVGIAMAMLDFGAYAIIGQQLTFFVITNAVVWFSISWRPKATFGRAALREVTRPGLGVMTANTLAFLDSQAPRFLIGKLQGASPLGYFAVATRLRFALTEIFITSPLAVVYPALAKLGDPVQQRGLALTVSYLATLLSCPLLAIGAATAPIYVPLVFGAQWLPAVPVLEIYLVGAGLAPFYLVIQQLFRANNRMRTMIRYTGTFIGANLLMTLFLLREADGLLWMSGGIAAVAYLSVPVYVRALERTVGIGMWAAFPPMAVPFLGAALCYGAIRLYAASAYAPANLWLALVATCLLGAAVYAAVCVIFQFRRIREELGKIVHLRRRA